MQGCSKLVEQASSLFLPSEGRCDSRRARNALGGSRQDADYTLAHPPGSEFRAALWLMRAQSSFLISHALGQTASFRFYQQFNALP